LRRARVARRRRDDKGTARSLSRPLLPFLGRAARVIAFLASGDAAFVSGVAPPVDGGPMAGNRIMTAESTLEPI
jgi:NAD(P)-dependent dehydrogenase (short-subunit alcohol dehydrogenase family)